MATFFGEVIEPSCNSLWYSDESDDENISTSKKAAFTVSILDEIAFTSKYALMVIVHGKQMTDFILSYFDTDTTSIIATFSEEKSGNDGNKQQKNKHNLSVLYKLTDDVVLFAASSCINEINSYALVTEVMQCIERCSEILILYSLPLAHYKSTKNDVSSSETVVRYLKTKSYKSAVHAPLLEVPNIMSGFPAAVLTLCHFKNLSAILYVCYSQSSFFNSTTAVPLLEILKKSSHNFLTQVGTFSELQKKLVNSTNNDYIMSSNLYI